MRRSSQNAARLQPDAAREAAELPRDADAGLAGLAVQEVLGELDGAWAVCDAVDAEDHPVRMWISTHAAADDPLLRDRVARLADLRAAGAAEEPLAPLAGVGVAGGQL